MAEQLQLVESIGTVLRRAREASGKDLETLAQQTRIKKAHLEAIERDDLRALPPGPFVKGFVLSYAKAVGLKPEQILPLLPDIDTTPNAHAMAVSATERRNADIELRELSVGGRPRSNGVVGVLLTVGVVGVILGLLWQNPDVRDALRFEFRKPEAADSAAPPSAPSTSTASRSAGGESRPALSKPSSGAASASAPQGASAGATSGASTSSASTSGASTSGASTSTSATSSTSTAPAASAGLPASVPAGVSYQRLSAYVSESDQQSWEVYTDPANKKTGTQTLVLSANAKSYVWVSSTPEGGPQFEGVLQEGEQKTFTAKTDVWIKVGNAAGVSISYNGQPLGSLGKYGDRKGLGFRLNLSE